MAVKIMQIGHRNPRVIFLTNVTPDVRQSCGSSVRTKQGLSATVEELSARGKHQLQESAQIFL